MGQRHAGFHCLLNNGDFPWGVLRLRNSCPNKTPVISMIRASVRHTSKPVSYFKIHSLYDISRGLLKRYRKPFNPESDDNVFSMSRKFPTRFNNKTERRCFTVVSLYLCCIPSFLTDALLFKWHPILVSVKETQFS